MFFVGFSPAGVKEIDIAATLEHVRDQRPGMVRTKVSNTDGGKAECKPSSHWPWPRPIICSMVTESAAAVQYENFRQLWLFFMFQLTAYRSLTTAHPAICHLQTIDNSTTPQSQIPSENISQRSSVNYWQSQFLKINIQQKSHTSHSALWNFWTQLWTTMQRGFLHCLSTELDRKIKSHIWSSWVVQSSGCLYFKVLMKFYFQNSEFERS